MKQYIKTKAIKIILFACFLFTAGIINAQIGIGIASPDASAQLDLSSTSRGFLPPRMTQAQRNSISNPAAGLMIWCKDCGVAGEIQVYNGVVWTNPIGGYPASPIPKTVTIGNQNWMTRNLDVVTYRNGDTIPEVKDPNQWASLTTGAWCYYNNDSSIGDVYGKLYNVWAIMDPRGLAPAGWNIPNQSDWTNLTTNLGGESVAGGKMKMTTLWNSPNAAATNESGFTAIPGGERNFDGSFRALGNSGTWWSNSESYDIPFALNKDIYSINNEAGNLSELSSTYIEACRASQGPDCIPKQINYGFSVRCVTETVLIGTQEWMARNLEVTTYRNGDIIPMVDPSQWANLTTGAWCYYNQSHSYGAVYGKIYNWYAVNDPRGLAPAGFHIASDEEWTILTDFLGGNSLAGSKIKETGTKHWKAPNSNATNETGFTALPGGKLEAGTFKQLGEAGSWWSSTGVNNYDKNAWYREVNFYYPNVYRWDIQKYHGFAVRCIKD